MNTYGQKLSQLDNLLDYGKVEQAVDLLNEMIEEYDISEAARALAMFHYSYIRFGYDPKEITYGFDSTEDKGAYFLLIVSGVTSFCGGKFKDAVNKFTTALSMFPTSLIPNYFLASIYSRGKYRDEDKMLHFINQLDPFEYIDIMNGEEESFGLPEIFVIAEDENPHQIAFQLMQEKRQVTVQNAEIERLNAELKHVNEVNNKMVKRYSHNWTNLLIPEKVLNVIQSLKQHGGFDKETQTLLDAYNNEVLLKHQSRMLELRHTGDPSELKTYIKKGRASERDDKLTVDVYGIIAHSLQRVLFRLLFHQSDSRAAYFAKKLETTGKDISHLRNCYTETFLLPHADWIKWVCTNLYPLIVETTPDWDEVILYKESGANAFMDEIFSELLLNQMVYSKLDAQAPFLLSLDSESIDGQIYVVIRSQNSIEQNGTFTGGTKEGIPTLDSLLSMLNDREKSVETTIDNQTFSVTLSFKKDLIVKKKRGRL